MSPNLKTLARWITLFVDPRKVLAWFYLPRFVRHWRKFQSATSEQLLVRESYPCLNDWVASTPFDPHYFYQGAWLARALADTQPDLHVDVGSSVLTIGVLSAHVPTMFVDYRPLNAALPNLSSISGTILSLPFADGSISSLSSMHVIEHIGLGRYGDSIDPEGALKAALELVRVLKPGGRLYVTAPIGRARVCFNAHRVFSPEGLASLFAGLEVKNFNWVDDQGDFHSGGVLADAVAYEYACGFYEFEKSVDSVDHSDDRTL